MVCATYKVDCPKCSMAYLSLVNKYGVWVFIQKQVGQLWVLGGVYLELPIQRHFSVHTTTQLQ